MQQNSALLRFSHHVQFLYNSHHSHRQLIVLFYKSILPIKLAPAMEAWCHGLSQLSHSSVETLNWTQDQRNKTLHSSTFLIISSFHTTHIISITSVTNKKSVLFFLLACTCFIFGIPVVLYSLFNNINVLHVYNVSSLLPTCNYYYFDSYFTNYTIMHRT